MIYKVVVRKRRPSWWDRFLNGEYRTYVYLFEIEKDEVCACIVWKEGNWVFTLPGQPIYQLAVNRSASGQLESLNSYYRGAYIFKHERNAQVLDVLTPTMCQFLDSQAANFENTE